MELTRLDGPAAGGEARGDTPEGNAIERLWLDVHNNVTRNHRHAQIELVLDDASRYIDSRDGRGARAVATLKALPAEGRIGAF